MVLHLKIRQIWEQRMSPIVQRFPDHPQHAREVGSKRSEDDGEVPALVDQVFKELEEGGQDPVVQSAVFSFDHHLSVPLQETVSNYSRCD